MYEFKIRKQKKLTNVFSVLISALLAIKLHKRYVCNIMKYSELKNILKKHNLRITDCRMDVLELFLTRKNALSFKDLVKELDEYDKVTLYRTLSSFTNNGVLHRIPDDSGYANYGICSDTCEPHEHKHNHMHFKCSNCGKMECLSEEHLPEVTIPGYLINEVNMILNGVCPQCL